VSDIYIEREAVGGYWLVLDFQHSCRIKVPASFFFFFFSLVYYWSQHSCSLLIVLPVKDNGPWGHSLPFWELFVSVKEVMDQVLSALADSCWDYLQYRLLWSMDGRPLLSGCCLFETQD
jgi:hypothetical protein